MQNRTLIPVFTNEEDAAIKELGRIRHILDRGIDTKLILHDYEEALATEIKKFMTTEELKMIVFTWTTQPAKPARPIMAVPFLGLSGWGPG